MRKFASSFDPNVWCLRIVEFVRLNSEAPRPVPRLEIVSLLESHLENSLLPAVIVSGQWM